MHNKMHTPVLHVDIVMTNKARGVDDNDDVCMYSSCVSLQSRHRLLAKQLCTQHSTIDAGNAMEPLSIDDVTLKTCWHCI
jgi:hypothetical protein